MGSTVSTATLANFFSENFVPDAFSCSKCGSILVDYDENDIVYEHNSVSKAFYSCTCLDCNNKFRVFLKDVM